MSRKYKVRDNTKLHFVTFATVYWLDIFTRTEYKNLLIDSLRHCQKHKALDIYAWCIMTNHLHMINLYVKYKLEKCQQKKFLF